MDRKKLDVDSGKAYFSVNSRAVNGFVQYVRYPPRLPCIKALSFSIFQILRLTRKLYHIKYPLLFFFFCLIFDDVSTPQKKSYSEYQLNQNYQQKITHNDSTASASPTHSLNIPSLGMSF